MSPRLLALDQKLFGPGFLQPLYVALINVDYDAGGGMYLTVTLASGHEIRSRRLDADDTATLARLQASRDSLVDRVNEALVDAREPLPGPSEPEKVRLA